MKMKESFNADELKPSLWQFQVCHENVEGFEIDDLVFLKSNPDVPLKVIGLDAFRNKVYVRKLGSATMAEYVPQVILQYELASLVKTHRNHEYNWMKLCLN